MTIMRDRFYKGGNQGTERASYPTKVTQLLSGRGGIGTQVVRLRNPCSKSPLYTVFSAPPFLPTPLATSQTNKEGREVPGEQLYLDPFLLPAAP